MDRIILHDADGFLIGNNSGVKEVASTIEATHDNTEAILSRIKGSVRSNRKMQVTGSLKLVSQTKAERQRQQRQDARRRATSRQDNAPLAEAVADAVAESVANAVADIGANEERRTISEQSSRQARRNAANRQNRHNTNVQRSAVRQERLLHEISENIARGNARSGFLSGLLSKMLPMLLMGGIGGGALKTLFKLPALLTRGLMGAVVGAGAGQRIPQRTPNNPNPNNPNSQDDDNHGIGKKIMKWAKGIGKGGFLASIFAGIDGFDVENSDMDRADKNKQHFKNFFAAGGGVAGAAAGATAGATIGSVVPVVGTVAGGILGAVLGGLGGATLAEYFIERVDESIDPRLSRNMFGSWKGFIATMNYGGSMLWQQVLPNSWAAYFQGLGIDTSSYFTTIEGLATVTWDSIKASALHVWDVYVPEKAKAFFVEMAEKGSAAWSEFTDGFKDLFKKIAESEFGKKVQEEYNEAKQTLKDNWEATKQYAGDAWESAKDFVGYESDSDKKKRLERQAANERNRGQGGEAAQRQQRQAANERNRGQVSGTGEATAQSSGDSKVYDWNDLKLKNRNKLVNYNGKNVIEAIGGGHTEQGTKQLAGFAQSQFGANIKHFSAFNDVYHKVERPRSNHTKGLAFDFTLSDEKGNALTWEQGYQLQKEKNIKGRIEEEMLAAGLKPKDFYILSYQKGERHGTAPHFHVEFKSKQAAKMYEAYSLMGKSGAKEVAKQSSQPKAQAPKQTPPKQAAVQQKGAFRFGGGVDEYITEASQKYGIDEATLRGFVKMEGGWTGKMSNKGAIGTGQFVRDTWNELAGTKEGKEIGMTPITNATFRTAQDPRHNKRINTLATGLLAKRNARILERKGVPVTGENLYLMHNIGQGVADVLAGNSMSDKQRRAVIKSMQNNNMKQGESVEQFARRQRDIFNGHYKVANKGFNANVTPPKSQQVAMNTKAPNANIQAQTISNANAQKGSTLAANEANRRAGAVGGQIAHAPVSRQVSRPDIAAVASGGMDA